MRIAMAFEFVAERNRPEVHDIEGVYTESELERAQPMGFQPNPVTEDEEGSFDNARKCVVDHKHVHVRDRGEDNASPKTETLTRT